MLENTENLENDNPISPKDFAAKIKSKYPEYKDVDDITLAKKMVEKYPEYKSQVNFNYQENISTEKVKKKENTVSQSVSENGNSSSVSKNVTTNNAFANRVLDYHKKAPTEVPQIRTNPNGKKVVGANIKSEKVHYDPITGNQRVIDKDVKRFDTQKREQTYVDAKIEANAPLEYKDVLDTDILKEKFNFSTAALQAYVAENNIPINAPEDWDKARDLLITDKVSRIATKQTTDEINVKRVGDFLSKQSNPFSGDVLATQNQLKEYTSRNNPIINKLQNQYSDKLEGIDFVDFDLFTKESGILDQHFKKSNLNQNSSYQTENDAVGILDKYVAWKSEKALQDMAIYNARMILQEKENPENVDVEMYNANRNQYKKVGSELSNLSNNIKKNIIPKFEKYVEEQKERKEKHEEYAKGGLGISSQVTAENTWNKVNETLLGITTSAVRLLGDGANILTEGNYNNSINSFFDGFVDILVNGSENLAFETVKQNVIDNSKTYLVDGKKYIDRNDGYIYDEKNNIVNNVDLSKSVSVTDNKEFNPIGVVSEGINQIGLVTLSGVSKSLSPYFLVSYENNRRQYLDAFPESTSAEAITYATTLSTIELLSERIMPDAKYFEMGWGKQIVNALKGVDKSSRGKALGFALKGYTSAILKENAEEMIPTLAQFGINNAINLIYDKESALKDDITSDEVLSTIAVTTAFSGLMAGRNARYDYKAMRGDMSLNDIVVLSSRNQNVKNKIDELLNTNEVVELIGIENVQEFQKRSAEFEKYKNRLPDNTTFEQFENVKELLDEKEQLLERRKDLDDNFVEPIDSRIEEINSKIKDVYEVKSNEEVQDQISSTEESNVDAEIENNQILNKTVIEENITEDEVKIKSKESFRHERTSLIIDEAKSGKSNIIEEIADQNQLLSEIKNKYGENSEQYKEQELIVNELNDYQNNSMFDNGQYQLRIEDGQPIVTSKSGKSVNENTKRAVVKEAIAAGKFSESKRVLDQEGLVFQDESQVINYVAENSQNPSEIAEMIEQQQIIDNENSLVEPKESAIADRVRNRGVKKSSFVNNSDKNQITKQIESSYLSNNGRPLDQIAMEVEIELYGDYNANQPRVTEQDIVDFILNNPSSKDYFAKNESSEMQKLKENFSKYSGIPATKDNISLFLNNQNESEVNQLNNPEELNDNQISEEELNSILNDFEQGVFVEDYEDSLPFQKGEGSFKKISKKAFNKLVDQLQKAFGGKNNIITSEADFKAKMKEFNGNSDLMRTNDGNIFGAVFPDGTIYLDQNNLNANTPIHEFGHIWLNIAKQQNSDIYNQAIEIVMQDQSAMNEIRNDPSYQHLKTDEEIANEVLAKYIGNVGEKSYWDNKDAGLVNKIKTVINNILDYVKELLGKTNINVTEWSSEQFQNATIQELAEGISNDLLSGKRLFEDNSTQQQSEQVQLSTGYGPGSTVNLNPNNTNTSEPSRLMPEKIHKRLTELLRDGLKKRKKTSEVIKDGIEYLEKQDWYNNLTDQEKSYLDSNLITYMKKGFEPTPKQKSREDIQQEVERHRKKGLSDTMILDKFKNDRDRKIAKDIIEREASKNKTNKQVASKVKNVFDTARERQKAKINLPRYFKNIKDSLLIGFVDNQMKVNNLLKSAGLDLVRNYIHAARGASSVAQDFYNRKAKEIYKGFSNKDLKIFNDIVMAKRIIQIDKDRESRGLEPVIHSGNISGNDAQIFLNNLETEIGTEKFKMFEDRSTKYFDANKEVLKKLKDNGIITQELYDNLKDLDYQRREYIDFMKDEEGHYLDQNSRVSKNAKEPIMSMEDGSDAFLIMESDYLLQRTIAIAENAIARNGMTSSLATEMAKQKNRIEQLKNKDPKDLSNSEKNEIKYFEQLEKEVVFDKKEAGRGFIEIKYKENGEDKSIFMKQEFADTFRELHVAQKLNGWLGILKIPSAVIKMIATGNNPTFAIVNTPRDIMNVAVLSKEYSMNVIGNLLEVSYGASKGAISTIRKNALYEKYIEYGGGMDFLNRQGDIRKTDAYDIVMNMVDRRVRSGFDTFFGIIKMQAIQDASEMGVRLAVFEKGIKNRFKAEGVKNEAEFRNKYANEGEVLVNKRLRDLYTSAVHSARSTADFSQKGVNYDVMEAIIPYFNAAQQSKRFLINSFMDRPKETTFRVLQGAAFTASTVVGGSLALIASLRDSDDEEDKKLSTTELYLKMYSGVSEHDRANYNIIFTGRKKESGEYEYYRVAKSQDLTPFHSLIDGAIISLMKKQVGDDSETKIAKNIWGSVSKNISPLEISIGSGNIIDDILNTGASNASKNPLLKGLITYQTGYDFFRNQPLSYQNGKVEKELEGYEMKNVEEFYKEIGRDLDISPARLKGAVESMITTPSTSPGIGLIYGGADYIIAEEKSKDKKMLKDYVLKSFSGRVSKETSDYNRNRDKYEIKPEEKTELLQNRREEIEHKQNVKVLAEKVLDKKSNFSITDAVKEIEKFEYESEINRNKDVPRRIKQLQERIKNKGVSQAAFDVKYETNKVNKAFLVQKYFGDELVKKSGDKYILKDFTEISDKHQELFKQMHLIKAIDNETIGIYLESFNK